MSLKPGTEDSNIHEILISSPIACFGNVDLSSSFGLSATVRRRSLVKVICHEDVKIRVRVEN